MARTQSTFSDFLFEPVYSDSEQDEAFLETSQEAPLEAPLEAPPAPPVTTPETPQEAPFEAPLEPPPAPPVTTPETPQEAPLEAPQEPPPASQVTTPETPQEAPLEAPQEPPPASPITTPETPQEALLEGRQGALPAPPVTSPETPQETSETDDCDDAQNDSGPGTLRSRDDNSIPTLADLAKNSVEKECTLSDLKKLKVKDCGGDVIAKEAIPSCDIHVGDKMVLTNDQGFPMNAREITEHIRTSPEQTIVLTTVRGAVGIVIKEEFELVINIKGSQTVILDTVDAIRRACTSPCSLPYAGMPERSNLTITEINDIPMDIGSHPDQIAKSMREALETSRGGITLRLVPQSLLDYLAEEDDETYEEQAHDMVND